MNISVDMNSSRIQADEDLSQSPFAYIAWSICFLGLPVCIFCLHFIIKVMKLNPYIKTIFVLMTLQYLLGYIMIISSLIAILFCKVQNYLSCMILTLPLTTQGGALQSMSALMSSVRFYMGRKTAKNRVYSHAVIVFMIVAMVLVYLVLNIFLAMTAPTRIMSKCYPMTHTSKYGYANLAFILATSCIGIISDIGMMKLLKQMKTQRGIEAQLGTKKS